MTEDNRHHMAIHDHTCLSRLPARDTRIVYGVNCVWWDDIGQAGKMPGTDGPLGSLPCCPHCHSVLMQVDGPIQWWNNVAQHEAKGHPGYRAFVEWMKGKCFPDIQTAKAKYEAETGLVLTL